MSASVPTVKLNDGTEVRARWSLTSRFADSHRLRMVRSWLDPGYRIWHGHEALRTGKHAHVHLRVSALAANIDCAAEQDATEYVDRALQAGFSHIDTAAGTPTSLTVLRAYIALRQTRARSVSERGLGGGCDPRERARAGRRVRDDEVRRGACGRGGHREGRADKLGQGAFRLSFFFIRVPFGIRLVRRR